MVWRYLRGDCAQENDGGGRSAEGFFDDSTHVHSGLGRRALRDLTLSKGYVLAIQQYGYDLFLPLASKKWSEMGGYVLRGQERLRCQLARGCALAKLDGGLDLCHFGRAKPVNGGQFLDMCTVETLDATEPVQELLGKGGSVLAGNALLEASLANAKHYGDQLRGAQALRPVREKLLSWAFIRRPALYAV